MNPTVTLAVVKPHYHGDFDPSIQGVDPISREGTPVPSDKVNEVRKAARQNGIAIKTVR